MEDLFDVPFKDFVIVAGDGRKIPVHRCVLYASSEFFKALFTNKMMQETRLETKFDYDALLLVIKWIYGVRIQHNNRSPIELRMRTDDGVEVMYHKIYEIADMFEIFDIIDCPYLFTDDSYNERFLSILRGAQIPTLMEERRFDEIYQVCVGRLVELIRNTKTHDIVYSYPPQMIVDAAKLKTRRYGDLEFVMLMYNYKGTAEAKKELTDALLPIINLNCLYNFTHRASAEFQYRVRRSPKDDLMVAEWMTDHGLVEAKDEFTGMSTYWCMLFTRTKEDHDLLGYLARGCSYADLSDMEFYFSNNDSPPTKKLCELVDEDGFDVIKYYAEELDEDYHLC